MGQNVIAPLFGGEGRPIEGASDRRELWRIYKHFGFSRDLVQKYCAVARDGYPGVHFAQKEGVRTHALIVNAMQFIQ